MNKYLRMALIGIVAIPAIIGAYVVFNTWYWVQRFINWLRSWRGS